MAIAMGEPKHITRYCGRLAPGITCLTGDSGGEMAYRAYGLKEGGLKELASFDVLKAGFRAMSQGSVGGRVIGNPRMLPGTFIVSRQGRITWTYYSKHAGDHPEINAIIRAAGELNEE